MYYGLVYYPYLEHPEFHRIRNTYEPYADLLREHISFIYPVPDQLKIDDLKDHIDDILSRWKPFKIHIQGLSKTWDHWLVLIIKQGNQEIIDLHDQFYTGILSDYLRFDLPYLPRITLGLFSKENYDPQNPVADTVLDELKYNKARRECEESNFDFYRTLNQLTLVQLTDNLSECSDVYTFNL